MPGGAPLRGRAARSLIESESCGLSRAYHGSRRRVQWETIPCRQKQRSDLRKCFLRPFSSVLRPRFAKSDPEVALSGRFRASAATPAHGGRRAAWLRAAPPPPPAEIRYMKNRMRAEGGGLDRGRASEHHPPLTAARRKARLPLRSQLGRSLRPGGRGAPEPAPWVFHSVDNPRTRVWA